MNSDLKRTVEGFLINEAGVPSEKLADFIAEVSVHLREVLYELDDAIDEGDFEAIIETAHKLKGSLCNLGLDELSMVAKNIETTAASNTPAHLACYSMRLQRELKFFFE